MIKNNLQKMLIDAIKSKDESKVNIIRLIKSELTKAEKDGITLDDATEIKILNKMKKQREESIIQYKKANRMELAEIEQDELDFISNLLPKEATIEEIEEFIKKEYMPSKPDGYKLQMSDIKPIMALVQKKYPTANGKLISEIIKKN